MSRDEHPSAVTTLQRPAAAGAPGGGRLRQKLSRFFVEPPDPTRAPRAVAERRTVEELEEDVRSASDKERIVGLLGAPFAAAIGLLVYGALAANDPSASLKDGLANSKHVSLSLYGDLLGVLLALSVVMLGTAWFRKRLYLGCAMALYGLAVFNMHYWGFGVPYVLFGAWMLVRAWRAQRDLREATGAGASRASAAFASAPLASKRYTPPSSRRPAGPAKGKRARTR